jgi:hypothetical protein
MQVCTSFPIDYTYKQLSVNGFNWGNIYGCQGAQPKVLKFHSINKRSFFPVSIVYLSLNYNESKLNIIQAKQLIQI